MPLHELGLIIIDEAHETTYKQEQHPKYHAIPTAAQRAKSRGRQAHARVGHTRPTRVVFGATGAH
jgi:primosomal protein N'